MFGRIPPEWDEKLYILALYPDVAAVVASGQFGSGYEHYLKNGRMEGRMFARVPAGWNEAGYLAANPLHPYRNCTWSIPQRICPLQRPSAVPKAGSGVSRRRTCRNGSKLRWPSLQSWLFKVKEFQGLALSAIALKDAIKTVGRQAGAGLFCTPRGQRIWRGQDKVILELGGTGKIHAKLDHHSHPDAWGVFWFDPPERMYCLSRPKTHMSGLDPFRFTWCGEPTSKAPTCACSSRRSMPAFARIIDAVELGGRFEFWLRELVRINAEEAERAGHEPFPLFDFSEHEFDYLGTDTGDGCSQADFWFWEVAHYREITGDLILDRVFGSSRSIPSTTGGLRRSSHRRLDRRAPEPVTRQTRSVDDRQLCLDCRDRQGCATATVVGSSERGDLLVGLILASGRGYLGLSPTTIQVIVSFCLMARSIVAPVIAKDAVSTTSNSTLLTRSSACLGALTR